MVCGGVSAKIKKYTTIGDIWMGTWATGMILLAWAYLNAIWFCQDITPAVRIRITAAKTKKKS